LSFIVVPVVFFYLKDDGNDEYLSVSQVAKKTMRLTAHRAATTLNDEKIK